MSSRLNQLIATLGIAVAFLLGGYALIWLWLICRIYIPPGYVLHINQKIGEENPDQQTYRVVNPGVKGIQKTIYGEGRYFINPIINDRTLTPLRRLNAEIGPDEVGIVKSLSGKVPPHGQFLVEAKSQMRGIVRQPLTPGVWRINPKAYEIKRVHAIKIHPGFVGCVISLAGDNPSEGTLAKKGQRGVMEEVLQPGLYYLNLDAYRVETVEVGYRQQTFDGLNFKSKDGFEIKVDISVVWGIIPAKVPYIIDRLGNIKEVYNKIIWPQVESICRIEGSKYGAVELIEGKSREKFQNDFTQKLVSVCERKDIQILLGLVRHIVIPIEISDPIQKAKIAQEEMRTKKELQKTQEVVNELQELRQKVEKAIANVKADTERMEANELAKGQKLVAEIKAQQQVDVAELQKQVAEIEATTTRLLGQARATAKELKRRAEADKLVQNIKAIGSAEAYTLYTFASSLSDKMQIFIRYAGQGTFWTDLPEHLKKVEKMAGFKILSQE